MSKSISVIHVLSDGYFHSGQSIGTTLGVSRAAVWKTITKIRQDWHVDIQSVKGKGYRINGGLNLLNANRIRALLPDNVQLKINVLELLTSVESTNQYLLSKSANTEVRQGHVVMAEYQTSGRGRRGRTWLSPFGQNLYISALFEFVETTPGLSGLSLVVAIVILRVLKRAGVQNAGLKWPNDIHCDGKKLCGILLEMKGEITGIWNIVVGIGLNVNMPNEAYKEITQPWTSLQQITGSSMERSLLAADIISELFTAMEQFRVNGMGQFRHEWNSNDLALNKIVKLQTSQGEVIGMARGIDDHGALLLEIDGEVRHYHAGEVSLRYNESVC
jgi:BirA family biotin operon repressor/biotin-[acetyl-CoA-carboxylase] ligase